MASDVQTEPSKNDLRAVVPAGVEKEPAFLWDTSGSMSWPAKGNSGPSRWEVVHEAIGTLVSALEGEDSQAAAEAAAGEDAGGVMTTVFSDRHAAECIDDISSENLDEKWDAIDLGGDTFIVPGWGIVVSTFMEEFGDRPAGERPALLVVVITDGEARDYRDFVHAMSKIDQGNVYVVMAVVGDGPEHDKTLRAYQQIDAEVKNFRVVTFGGETNPTVISDGLLSLMA
jgi:hypothetical protein